MTEKNAGQNDSNRWEGNPDTTAFPPAGGNQQRGPWVPGNDFSGGQGSGPYTPPQFHGQEPSQGQGQGQRPGYGPPPYQQQPFPPQGPPKQTQGWVIPVVIIGVLIVLAILGTIIAGLAGWITFGGGEEEGPEVVTEVVVVPGEGEAEANRPAPSPQGDDNIPNPSNPVAPGLPGSAYPANDSAWAGNPGGNFNNVYTGSSVTSEEFARQVRSAFVDFYYDTGLTSGIITAYSPVTGLYYSMDCVDNGSYVTCTGGNNAVVYIS